MNANQQQPENPKKLSPVRTTLAEPLKSWSGQPSPYPDTKTVAALFEEIVAGHPDRTALILEDSCLTYSELNVRANRLAHHLQRMGIYPETLVGCCLERSIDLIVAILAILKGGGAYVPLDPSYPRERIDFFLKDTRTPVVLTQKSLASAVLPKRNLQITLVDDLKPSSFKGDDANPTPKGNSSSLAYVMYTSGSTGRPKGVMIENRGIVRLVRNTNYCRFAPDEVFLQFAPISFDASTFEIWGALLNGSTLVIAPPHPLSLEDLGRIIRDNGVTTLWLAAGLFHLMVEERTENLRTVRQLLAGGDLLSPAHVERFLKQHPQCSLINGYGPTENTTFTCCHRVTASDPISGTIPIGKPISNTQVYILNHHLCPVAPGDIGELYAAGAGLARGYLNDDEATATAFLPNPFGPDDTDRIYRTGDLARWRQDGSIEFLGRIDNQVKILGYRIEPNEVEAVLAKHPGVQRVCVVPQDHENGSKHLTAFYIPSEFPTVSSRQLREFALDKLPRYMVPAKFIALSALPLSLNGKLDRVALSRMRAASGEQPSISEPPQTQLESTLRELWTRALRVREVGLDDNFFDLGGDSLLLLTVHSELQRILESRILVTDLFEFPTIRKLARHISASNNDVADPLSLAIQQQAQRQRDAFSRFRESHGGDS